jgi:hypothetical protein
MPHPQERELREKLGVFFSDAPGLLARRYRTLTVFEKDSGANILFGYSDAVEDEDDEEMDDDEWDALVEELDRIRAEREAAGVAPAAATSRDPYVEDGAEMKAWVQFPWGGAGSREKKIARRLGLPAPRMETHSNPFTGETFKASSRALCDVAGVDEALAICWTVLMELYRIPEDRWLWITDDPEYELWPNPLPKPEPWPPA